MRQLSQAYSSLVQSGKGTTEYKSVRVNVIGIPTQVAFERHNQDKIAREFIPSIGSCTCGSNCSTINTNKKGSTLIEDNFVGGVVFTKCAAFSTT